MPLFRTVVALTFAFVTVAAAQEKPNISGKWTLDPASPSVRLPATAVGWGQEFTANQNANTLTVEYTQGKTPVKLTYKLDGSNSSNTLPGRGGEPRTEASKAVRYGAKLSITITTVTADGNTVEVKRVVSLEGGSLIIETTPTGFGGATMKAVYKKS
jgi:hypothetical protein